MSLKKRRDSEGTQREERSALSYDGRSSADIMPHLSESGRTVGSRGRAGDGL